MSNQRQSGAGTVYDGDDVVAQVTYELAGQAGTGVLTFADILVREQVVELLEGGALTLVTQDGARRAFELSGVVDGATPMLTVDFTDEQ